MKFVPREMQAPSDLSSKLVDWNALAAIGGESLIAGKDVLDLGPCYGLDAFLFARMARSYVAVDTDDHVIAWLRERVPEVAICACSVTALPHHADTFDMVFDFSTIDNCDNPWSAYREAVRVLRPGGVLLTTFANALLVAERPNEHPVNPGSLRRDLEGLGTTFRYAANWHDTRAVLAMVKK